MKKLMLILFSLATMTFLAHSAPKSSDFNLRIDDPIQTFLNSVEFARVTSNPNWSSIGELSTAKSFVRKLDGTTDGYSVNIVFENENNIKTVIEAVKTSDRSLVPNQEEYFMVLKDYSSFNVSSRTGVVSLYDLNYSNHKFSVITFNDGEISAWKYTPIPEEISSQYNVVKKSHFCDYNKNGDISFSECYYCMKSACSGHPSCMTQCDLYGFGSYCSGTIAAACVWIAAWN